MNLAFRVEELKKEYVLGGETVHALRGVTIEVPEGDYVAIMGPSGSGKSTLLNLLGCLDRPSSGQYLPGRRRRRQDVGRPPLGGSRWQHRLCLSVVQPDRAAHRSREYRGAAVLRRAIEFQNRARCKELARMVGLGERLGHRPTQLSGGQQQRAGDRPQPGQRSLLHAGRRADGQSGLGHLRRDSRPARRG